MSRKINKAVIYEESLTVNVGKHRWTRRGHMKVNFVFLNERSKCWCDETFISMLSAVTNTVFN
ncbi:hypothetical protein X777_06498 [Ooceraea biroi]|uniref:Uncharacterized protein n=1 Tax=Ooceraea biroi TaxID=2015173 RepID=A0A026WBF1_OOCBI|nr:hypothetical protein X777_06498 [Ooceraea biroi]